MTLLQLRYQEGKSIEEEQELNGAVIGKGYDQGECESD
jgi:hypothetical protein